MARTRRSTDPAGGDAPDHLFEMKNACGAAARRDGVYRAWAARRTNRGGSIAEQVVLDYLHGRTVRRIN